MRGFPIANDPQTTEPSGPTPADQLKEKFSDAPYQGPELQNILNNWIQSNSYGNYPDKAGWASAVRTALDTYASTFQSMFKNQVGRDPTSSEYDQFFKTVVTPEQPWNVNYLTQQDLTRQRTQGLLSDVYSGVAQQEAAKKLQEQSQAAVAPGSAFDQWSQSYAGSVNSVESALQDYQTRLFQKIQPQLLTSLKSQGLLDTGALNTALAGVQGDLASTGSNYVAGLKGQINQDIANQKYALQSAPTTYQLNTTAANPANLVSQGQTALGNVWNSYLMNQQYQQQKSLLDEQMGNQPSLLQQYGGLIAGGLAGGLGQGFGRRLAAGG